MSLDAVIYALDLAGIAVFAITGALAAMEKKLEFAVLPPPDQRKRRRAKEGG